MIVNTSLPVDTWNEWQKFRAEWTEDYAFGYAANRDRPFMAVNRITGADIDGATLGEFKSNVLDDAENFLPPANQANGS